MIVIALGSNIDGLWGQPIKTLRHTINILPKHGMKVISQSSLYYTTPHTSAAQPMYLNAIAIVETCKSPTTLLRMFKHIEALAGRTQVSHPNFARKNAWAPRPLDLDLISYHSCICNWRGQTTRDAARVIVPHPRAHMRAFVMEPLAEAAPLWHHPIFGMTAAQLAKSPRVRAVGSIIRRTDFPKVGEAEA